METKLTWLGFAAGVACVVLAAAAYRISWEFPREASVPEPTQQQQAPATRPAPRTPATLPLQRLDGPPATRRPAQQQPAPADEAAEEE